MDSDTVEYELNVINNGMGNLMKYNIPTYYNNLTQVLGAGSFGTVVKGQFENQDIALKILKMWMYDDGLGPRRIRLRHLIREIKLLNLVSDHPRISTMLEVFTADITRDEELKYLYICMEYAGPNLVKWLEDKKSLTLGDVAYIIDGITQGIKFLNDLAIYHRDLKPENVCVSEHGGTYSIKIIDLGLSRPRPEPGINLTPNVATMCYRAPEILFNFTEEHCQKLDVWSIGCIMAYIICDQEHIFNPAVRCYSTSQMELEVIKKIAHVLGAFPDGFNNLARSHKSDIAAANVVTEPSEDFENRISHFEDTMNEQRERDAYEALMGMLTIDPEERLSPEQLIGHNFLVNARDPPCNMNTDIPEEVRHGVREMLVEDERNLRDNTDDKLKEILFNFLVDRYPRGLNGKKFPYAIADHE